MIKVGSASDITKKLSMASTAEKYVKAKEQKRLEAQTKEQQRKAELGLATRFRDNTKVLRKR